MRYTISRKFGYKIEVSFKISLVNRFNEFRVTSCNYISCIRVSGYIVAREKVLNHRFLLVFHPSPPFFFSSRLIVTEYTLQTRVSYPLSSSCTFFPVSFSLNCLFKRTRTALPCHEFSFVCGAGNTTILSWFPGRLTGPIP